MKSEWVLKSHERFTVDVINVSSRDLAYLSRSLRKDVFAKESAARPALKRLVSANIASDSPDTVAPQPFVIKEVPARVAGGAAKNVRVAFVGLTGVLPAAPRGFKITDPVEAAKRVVPQAKKQADVVVVLAHVKPDEAARVAREAPGIDVIICGPNDEITGLFIPPVTVGETFVVFTPYESRMASEVRFYRGPEGKLSSRARFVTLDPVVADDAAALEIVAQARAAEGKVLSATRSLLTDWLAKTNQNSKAAPVSENGAASRGPHFVSSGACVQCHNAQYYKWTNSAHARAGDRLTSKPLEFEAGCLSCHATGSAKGEMAKLQNVQCEQCHGPGSDHVAKPARGYGRVANVQALCASCHTAETDARFDFATAWAKIKH